MDRFPRNFRDNLRVSGRTMLIAGLIIAALFVALVLAYSALDLGAVLPRTRL
jgi:hypothetical protein